MNKIPIAIIEDNFDLLDDLVLNLSHRGIAPSGFCDGAAFDAAMKEGGNWSVLVLDLGLPGEDGLSIARRLRENDPVLGIIMLTARGDVSDRIAGLSDGADMYLVKPVDMGELAAAVKAVARRVPAAGTADTWLLDAVNMKLSSPSGREIELTYPETQLINRLAQSPDHFGERDALIEAMGKNPNAYDPRALEVALSRLRQKLGEESPLKAVRARGYIFAAKLSLKSPI
jgi:DNA-binding response OmpR family regulator